MTLSGSGFKCYPLPAQLGGPGRMRSWHISENFAQSTPFSLQEANIFPGPSSLPPTEEIRTQIPELSLLSPSPGCDTSARRTGRSLRRTVDILRRPCFLLCLGGRAAVRPRSGPPPCAAPPTTPAVAWAVESPPPLPPAPRLPHPRLAVRGVARRVGVLRGDHGCRLLPPVPTVTIESHGCPGDAGAGRALLTAPWQLQSG